MEMELRASDADRERHVDQLREHAAQGRLDMHELSERVERAYAARTIGELAGLVADLPELRPRREPRPRRASRLPAIRGELRAFVLVNLLLVAIWAATGAGYFWPVWPIAGWGMALLAPGHCGTRSRAVARR